MNNIERGVLSLLKSAITGESYSLPQQFDLDQARKLMKYHTVLPLGYIGALHCGLDKHTLPMQKLFQAYCASTLISERQMKAVQRIYDAFDAQHIDYMPVKGCNMKQLYPEPGLRSMGDADILIKLNQYDAIRPIMLKLGYEELLESDHELDWKSPVLMVELHKRLIPSYNHDYYRYYGNGWRLASSVQGTHYFMSHEDEFIYIFTHLAKHYRDGGIGCRHVLDLWVYLRTYPDLDMLYIHQELEKLELLDFFNNMQKVVGYWFEDLEADRRTEAISAFLMGSGTWGTQEQHAVSIGAREAANAHNSIRMGQFKRCITLFFPPANILQQRYPTLERHSVLLPVFWVRRWCEALLFRRKNAANALNNLHTVSREDIQEYQDTLEDAGLHFNFEE